MSTFWIIAITISGLAFIGVIVYFALNLFFYRLSLTKSSLMKFFLQRHIKKNYKLFKIDYEWFEKINNVILYITSNDGYALKANYFKQKDNNKLAFLCHGYGADYREMCVYAKYFYNRGYSVLIPEFRAHGDSEGDRIGMGWPDRIDVKKWINHMVELNPNYNIVLFGLSMGASTVCMTVGEDLPKNVKCAISDCAYSNAYSQFEFVAKSYMMLGARFIMKAYNHFLINAFSLDLKKYDAIKQVKKAKIPMLFIHGDKDEFVSYENLKKLYNAHPLESHKYIYTCKGAKHALSYVTNEEEYEKLKEKILKK